MWRRALVLVAAGCGRVGFDIHVDDAFTSGDATGDATTDVTSGLVAWYKLDEGSGLAIIDSSSSADNGFTNACGAPYPKWGPGVVGDAMIFAAAADNCAEVTETPGLEIAGPWTISTWVKLASVPALDARYPLVEKPNAASQHNYALWADDKYLEPAASSTGWAVSFHDASNAVHVIEVPAVFVVGTWVHVAGRWDGTNLAVYVDGELGGSVVPGAVPSATPYSAGGTPILAYDPCCGDYLDGALDEVRIYNRALSAADIAQLHAAP